MSDEGVDLERRKALLLATAAAGGAATAAAVWPFVASLEPSERAKAMGAPVEVDIGGIAAGELKTIEWRGKPVWILHRTAEMVAELPKHHQVLADPESHKSEQPRYAENPQRSIKPDLFVAVALCTHSAVFQATGPTEMRPITFCTRASTALATVRNSTSQGGYTRTSLRRRISSFRLILTSQTAGC